MGEGSRRLVTAPSGAIVRTGSTAGPLREAASSGSDTLNRSGSRPVDARSGSCRFAIFALEFVNLRTCQGEEVDLSLVKSSANARDSVRGDPCVIKRH